MGWLDKKELKLIELGVSEYKHVQIFHSVVFVSKTIMPTVLRSLKLTNRHLRKHNDIASKFFHLY